MSGSPTFAVAVATWHALRAEFENVRQAAYTRAVDATNGALLNERGRAKGIDAYELFIGNETRARAYASPELIEHWDRHPRLTFAAYERQITESETAA